MADGGKVGEARIEITADASGLRAGLEGARAETANAAKSIEDNIGNKSKGAFTRATDAAKQLRSVITKVAVPAAVAGTVLRLVDAWRQVEREARAYQDRVNAITRDADKGRQATIIAGLSAQAQAEAALLEKYQQRQEQLTQAAQEAAEKGVSVYNRFQALFTDDPVLATEKIQAAANAQAQLERQKAGELADLRKRLAKEAADEEAKAQAAREEELRRLRLELISLERDERKRLQGELAEADLQLTKDIEKAKSDTAKALLIERIGNAKLEAIKAEMEIVAAREAAEKAANDRAIEDYRRKMLGVIQEIQDQQTGIFGGELIGTVQSILIELQTLGRVGR